MGEREMILVLAAIFFFTMFSLSANQFIIANSESMWQSEFEYNAISLAQSIIEEAKTRYFDVAVESGPTQNMPGDFTYPASARYDEDYPHFTDVDDFVDVSEMTFSTPYGDYIVSVDICYVEDTNPNQKVYHRTFHKKMTVNVSSDYIPADISISHVFSYYYF